MAQIPYVLAAIDDEIVPLYASNEIHKFARLVIIQKSIVKNDPLLTPKFAPPFDESLWFRSSGVTIQRCIPVLYILVHFHIALKRISPLQKCILPKVLI